MAGRGKKNRKDPRPEDLINWKETFGIEHPRQRAFLSALAVVGNPTTAARISKVSRTSHYNWLGEVDGEGVATKAANAYKRACEEAMDVAGDRLEYRCWQLATDEKHPNITALIFMLKAIRPKKFREHFVTEHTGPAGGPIETATKVEVVDMRELAQPGRLKEVTGLIETMGLTRQFPALYPGGDNGNGKGNGHGS